MHSTFAEAKLIHRDRWVSVLYAHGVPIGFLQRKHGPCPFCGGRDRFRFDDRQGDGTWICNCCGSGDGISLLAKWLRIPAIEAARLLAGGYVHSSTVPLKKLAPLSGPAPIDPALNRKRFLQIWNESLPIRDNDAAWLYLTKRLIPIGEGVPCSLRLHSELPYYDEHRQLVGHFSAMIALIHDISGEIVGMHQTFITSAGEKLPGVAAVKKQRAVSPGATKRAAIRLHQAGEKLGIAEGIETALACYSAWRIPVWASINAGNMRILDVPETVKEVVVFADNDSNKVGQSAAVDLSRRLLHQGKIVKIKMPSVPDSDWLDELTQGAIG